MKGPTALLSLTNLVVLPGKLSDCQTTDRENGVRKPNEKASASGRIN